MRNEQLVEVLKQYLSGNNVEAPQRSKNQTQSAAPAAIENNIDTELESSIADTLQSLGYDIDEDEVGVTNVLEAQPKNELVLPTSPLTSSLGDDPEFQAIVESFVERLNERIGELQLALEDGDFEKLGQEAHWLAGATGTVGYDEFVEPARELQYCNSNSDPERMQELVTYLTRLTFCIDLNQLPV